MSIVIFLFILAVLIFVHELGHFSVAKFFGIRVDEFAIGFPPRIIGFKKGETTYSLNLIPFGGFVKIFGENPNDESLHGPDSARSFIKKPRFVQALTLVAGIGFNIIFAWILISATLMIGLPTGEDTEEKIILQNKKVVVIDVLKDSPAFISGFEKGDQIISIQSPNEILTEKDAESARNFIENSSGKNLTFTIERNEKEQILVSHTKAGLIEDRDIIGVSLANVGVLKLPPHKALIEGVTRTKELTWETSKGLLSFIKDVFIGEANLKQITGPVGIVGLVGEASQFGFVYLLHFAAFISINLAVINFLPFPALDGGRLMVVGIEAVIRKPLNYTYVNILNIIGFIFLIGLMILVTYQDVLKLIVGN